MIKQKDLDYQFVQKQKELTLDQISHHCNRFLVVHQNLIVKKAQKVERPLNLEKGNKVWSAEEEDKKRKRAERFGFNPPSSVPQAKKPKTEAPNGNGETPVSTEPAKTEAAAS